MRRSYLDCVQWQGNAVYPSSHNSTIVIVHHRDQASLAKETLLGLEHNHAQTGTTTARESHNREVG
jgi:hypothetical protein